MDESVVATEIKLIISIPMTVEHVLAQNFKESATSTVQLGNINNFVNVIATETGNYSSRMS